MYIENLKIYTPHARASVRLIPTFWLIKYTKNLRRDFSPRVGVGVCIILYTFGFVKSEKRRVCVCFSQKWDSSDNVRWSPCQGRQHCWVIALLIARRIIVVCIQRRGFLSLTDGLHLLESCGKQQRIAHFYLCWPWSYLHISHKHTRPTASADATWFVFQSNKERHIVSAQSNPRTV